MIPYDGNDQAVAIANDSGHGLTGTIWTADIAQGEALANRVSYTDNQTIVLRNTTARRTRYRDAGARRDILCG